jgi:hypothetical protein
VFSADAGKLPAADTPSLAGITLPPGRIVHAGPGGRLHVAWISAAILPAEHLTDLIRRLAAAFAHTGLWPLRAVGLHDDDLDRPWGHGELEGPVGEIPHVSPLRVAAPATSGPELAAEELTVDAGALLLVPAGRPADVVAALGWWGATNHDRSGAEISAVLRSWEERFGAVLVSLGFDTMVVEVPRRPGPREVDGLLREHYALCPDVIDQGLEADAYRAGLMEWTHWHFWWD